MEEILAAALKPACFKFKVTIVHNRSISFKSFHWPAHAQSLLFLHKFLKDYHILKKKTVYASNSFQIHSDDSVFSRALFV